jgi:hypothetical protein
VEVATAMVPRNGAVRLERKNIEPRLASITQATVQVYELDYHEESQGFFFALGDQGWSFGSWSSDAQAIYCRIEKERLIHLVVIGGTHVAWQGKPLLKAARTSNFFEWRRQDAVIAEPSEFSVTPLFEELTGGANRSTADLNISSPYAEKH